MGYLYILERGLVGDYIDGVDEFEAMIQLWEFLNGGQIEEGYFAMLIYHTL